jgi:hypothetical protein
VLQRGERVLVERDQVGHVPYAPAVDPGPFIAGREYKQMRSQPPAALGKPGRPGKGETDGDADDDEQE